MLNKIKSNKGFTIVEVMIVLAIAGMIILIVFLAVPALQRQSRNNAIKSDVANLLAGFNEFQQNNNGMLPTTLAYTSSTGTATFSSTAAGTSPVQVKVRPGTVVNTPLTTGAIPTSTGTIQLRTSLKCDGSAFETTATPRAVAAGYRVETASSSAPQCTDS